MSSTKLIKRRVKSANNIAKITKAMEMVAASKMKRAQEQALATRPYSEKMDEIISSIVTRAKEETKHYLLNDPREHWNPEKEFNLLILVLSTDKSLCGGLNTNLFRGLEKWLEVLPEKYHLPKKIKLNFISIGKKAKEHLLKTNRFLLAEFPQLGDKPRFQNILPISELVMDGFKKKEFQMVFLVYMEFISTVSQKLAVRQLLPIKKAAVNASPAEAQAQLGPETQVEHLFEPSAEEIFNDLLPQFIEMRLYHVILESIASEHSARMVAMKNANDNALEIVQDLTLQFNQARQAKITNELLDVIGARMALE
jgi:F-type H+-transporting ATPase subunit gamma